MKLMVIETEGHGFAHLSRLKEANSLPGDVRLALCRKNPFPSKWDRPVKRTKPLCPACAGKARL